MASTLLLEALILTLIAVFPSSDGASGDAIPRVRFPQPVHGDGYVQGLIQVYHEGKWGTICTQAFDSGGNGEMVANVLCRMGGYRKGSWDWGRYNQNVKRSTYKTWLHTVLCSGRENSLSECTHSPWGETRSICAHKQKKGEHMSGGHYYEACVRCYHSGIRFPQPVYGNGYVQGLIQVYHEGKWGTICTQAFDSGGNGEMVANVLCRMGGYRKGSWDWGRYNQNVERSTYKTWLHTVLCSGRENSLSECTHSPWGETRSICAHKQKKGEHMTGGHYYEACVRCYN